MFQEALAVYHRLVERWHTIMTTGHLADVALGQGDVRRGGALYAECLALARDAGMRPQIARGLEGLACVALRVSRAGDPRRAARLLGAAAALGAGGWTPLRIEPDRPERLRAALGEAAFATASSMGRRCPWRRRSPWRCAWRGRRPSSAAQPSCGSPAESGSSPAYGSAVEAYAPA